VAADLSDIYMGHATWDSYTQVREGGLVHARTHTHGCAHACIYARKQAGA